MFTGARLTSGEAFESVDRIAGASWQPAASGSNGARGSFASLALFGPEERLAAVGLRMHNPGVPKTYSREEADEILRRALAGQSPDGIGHDELVAAAREVGIPESAIDEAASQLGEHRIVKQRVEQIRRQKRRGFGRHLLSYLVANGGIFLFDYFDGGPWFFQYVLILWGIILLLFGIRQLAPEEASLVRKAERELEKEQRRAERQRRRTGRAPGHPGGIPGAAKEFEHAVQEGVNALLSAAARAIRSYTPPEARRSGEVGPGDARPRAEDRRRYRAVDGAEGEAAESREEANARQRGRA